MTKQELANFAEVHALKQAALAEIEFLEEQRINATTPAAIEKINAEIVREQTLITMVDKALKGWSPRPCDALILAHGSSSALTVDCSPGALPQMPGKVGGR